MKSTLKYLLNASIFLLYLIMVAACSNNPSETSAEPQAVESDLVWTVDLVQWGVYEDLAAIQNEVQYNGDITQMELSEKPAEGYVYLIAELSIEKIKTGASSFVWKNLSIEDPNGEMYYRLANDTFLESFGFSRLKSTDLTLGKNEGYICFEIPQSLSKEPMVLVYESDEGITRLQLK